MANSLDKERKKMNILAYNNKEEKGIKAGSIIKSKIIICPKCGEKAKLNIQNYNIVLYDCKNGHKFNNLSFEQFEKTQNLDLSKIICDKCQKKSIADTYNNQFYKCLKCNFNLCPFCRLNHDKSHNIINYEEFNFICGNHNEKYSKYCKKCKINTWILCKNEHLNHETTFLEELLLDKRDLQIELNKFKENFEIFQNDINEMIQKIENVKENLNIYYKIVNDMINNYDMRNRNYETFFNLKEIINSDIIKDIMRINNENIIFN